MPGRDAQNSGGRPFWQALAEREIKLRSGALGRRVTFAAAVVLVILTLSTAGYVLIEDAGWFDSFYMSVITLATVGYSEVIPLGTGGRVFTVFVIIAGGGTVVYIASLLAQYLLSGQIAGLIGQRRMNKDIAGLSGHYVVCGFGHTGRRVAEELRRRGRRVIVADIDEAAVSQALVTGFPALQGDTGSDDTLRRAGVERAAGAVIAVAADADALMTVISARSLNKDMVVVARATDESNESKLRLAGANSVLPVHQMAGHNLAQMVIQPEYAVFLEAVLSEHGIELETTVVRVTETSPLLSHTLDESGLTEQADTNVFGIRSEDGRPTVISRHDDALKAGDIIVIIGTRQRLAELKEKATARR